MNNAEIARRFYRLSALMEIRGDDPFRLRSYRNAAEAIEVWPTPLKEIAEKEGVTGLQEIPGVTGPVVFANNQAFAIPAPGSNGSGRNIFRGPNYWNVDLGIVKLFDITERFKLQFRTEMFNAFNHPNFDNPRSASVGSPTVTSSQRQITVSSAASS